MRTQLWQPRTNVNRFGKPLAWVVFICGAIILGGSFAIAQEQAQNRQPPAQTSPNNDDDIEQLRKKVQELSAEVDRLKREVAKLDKYRQTDYIRDLLMKEEQRAESLQSQLVEIGAKEIPLQTRLDEIDAQLRPDRVEQSLAGVGSMRPEEDRDAVRRILSNEKRRLQTQLELLRQNRLRLQASLNTADASIARLRLRLNEVAR